jgi:N-acetylmuramoyl-L-alanine amidase
VWESLYVYDVMLRVRQLLESYSAARVVPLVRDGKEFRIEDKDVLAFSRGHAVLTTPPYAIADSKIGVNLRWHLANSVHRRAMKGGADPAKVVFISLHADSLHPSLRGAMAYVPEASLSGAAPANRGGEYASRKEVRDAGRYAPSRRELQRSEGLSRDLANHLIAAFRDQGLAVHPFKPVREKVIRNRRQWVPAVLRYNAVPAKILFEICNLANSEDRKLLQTRSYRHKVAEAIVHGILGYYSPAANGGSVQVAKKK